MPVTAKFLDTAQQAVDHAGIFRLLQSHTGRRLRRNLPRPFLLPKKQNPAVAGVVQIEAQERGTAPDIGPGFPVKHTVAPVPPGQPLVAQFLHVSAKQAQRFLPVVRMDRRPSVRDGAGICCRRTPGIPCPAGGRAPRGSRSL